MKTARPVITKLLHVVVLLAVLHAQLAFAVPGVPTLLDTGCNRHMTGDVTAGMEMSGYHGHHTGSQGQTDNESSMNGLCLDDDCCNGCDICGHCSAAIVMRPLSFAFTGGSFMPEVLLLPQRHHTDLIPHPPRRSQQS